jgi:hypothetical protein
MDANSWKHFDGSGLFFSNLRNGYGLGQFSTEGSTKCSTKVGIGQDQKMGTFDW